MKHSRYIIHVDMDAFYAAVEQLDHPELKGRPVIVAGSPQHRGVVSAASYEARPFGVHSAMPTAMALRLCPQAIVLPVRMDRYIELSHRIRDILYEFTPVIEPISIDEAFLDVTGSIRLYGTAEQIGHAIKDRIKNELHLVASLGIAANKFLAKLASDLDKPDGFVVIPRDSIDSLLDPLSVSRIWGVGKVTCQRLNSQGIMTIAQLKQTPLPTLQKLIGNTASDLLDLARGIDDRPVITESQAQSLSSETTFAVDIDDLDVLLSVIHEQVEEVAPRLRRKQLFARTITLKLRYGDFKTITRSQSLDQPTDITALFHQYAKTLFYQWRRESAAPLRLIGFGVSSLMDSSKIQPSLFRDPEQEKQQKIDHTLDIIQEKFGKHSLKRPPSLPQPGCD